MSESKVETPIKEAKPYSQTSYFRLMVGVALGGLPVILGTSWALPHVHLSAELGEQVLSTLVEVWKYSTISLVATNAAARGGVTLVKNIAPLLAMISEHLATSKEVEAVKEVKADSVSQVLTAVAKDRAANALRG